MSNTFRKTYRELTEAEKAVIEEIKETAERLEEMYIASRENGKNPRHIALALTALEESVMWAVKAITE
jgi:hypothetical protein